MFIQTDSKVMIRLIISKWKLQTKTNTKAPINISPQINRRCRDIAHFLLIFFATKNRRIDIPSLPTACVQNAVRGTYKETRSRSQNFTLAVPILLFRRL